LAAVEESKPVVVADGVEHETETERRHAVDVAVVRLVAG
jgi:hypothetical protein